MKLARVSLTVFFAFASLRPAESVGQEIVNGCDVPVVVTGFNNTLFRELTPTDFSVRLGGVPGTVDGARIDESPRRVALLLDASRNIPEDEWKLETEMAASFVEHARPKDQFAFFVIAAQGTSDSMLFSGDLAERLRKLTVSRPSPTEANERIYDAIFAAAKRLDPPQFGDAIFLFGHHEDSGSATRSGDVLELILKNRLRFFGMSFAEPLAKLPTGFDLNKPLPKGFERSNLELLSAETGYYFSFHSVRSVNYPGQMPLFKNFLANLYAWIAEPYRLRITTSPIQNKTKLEINVTDLEVRKIHKDGVHYPRALYPCATPKAPTDLKSGTTPSE